MTAAGRISPRSESLHERYDRDERALIDTAGVQLWTDHLLDAVIDVASPIMAGSSWDGLPDGAQPRTAERYTASSALMAMGLRAARTIALTVRAGYAPESLAGTRRLFEIAGHAQRVADDETGQYADNWLRRRGNAAKPRAAFGDPETDTMWKIMSGHAHAEFDAYARQSATLDGARVVHSIGPRRDGFWDDVALWFTARHLVRVLAAVLKVHPHIEQSDFLAVAGQVIEAEGRLEAEIAARPVA